MAKNHAFISLKIDFLHFSWSPANQAIVCCSSKLNKNEISLELFLWIIQLLVNNYSATKDNMI